LSGRGIPPTFAAISLDQIDEQVEKLFLYDIIYYSHTGGGHGATRQHQGIKRSGGDRQKQGEGN
jgi:hypothetical protein